MLPGVVGLALGTFHTILMKKDGSVWSSGIDVDGQDKSFVKVMPSGGTALAVGNYYGIVLTTKWQRLGYR